MKLAVIGATGWIGGFVLLEARDRGHEVTAVLRNPLRGDGLDEDIHIAVADIKDRDALGAAIEGHDAVISAYRAPEDRPDDLVAAARALIGAATDARLPRIVWVGSTATLKVPGGDTDLVDLPQFPENWKPSGLAHRHSLRVFREDSQGLDWTYISVPRTVKDGVRTGTYRVGGEELLIDEQGQSEISTEDLAVAILDEVEGGRHVRERMTVAY
jgi:uncharacterized protein